MTDTLHDLQNIVLSRCPACHHNFPLAGLTESWTSSWNEKICLLWLKPDRERWPYIIRWFREKGVPKSYDALHSKWKRASVEVTALRAAVKDYTQRWGEVDRSIGPEPRTPWDFVSASMKECGSKEVWTPGRVEYAWHHGVSGLVPEVYLVCTPSNPPILLD